MTVEEIMDTLYDIKTDAIYSLLSIETQAIEEATEILEKFESGKMIELPCKVGDTVYCILFSPKFDKLIVKRGFVESFKIDEAISARVLDCEVARYANVDVTVKISEFGKTVFLTRDEAEKALLQQHKTKL